MAKIDAPDCSFSQVKRELASSDRKVNEDTVTLIALLSRRHQGRQNVSDFVGDGMVSHPIRLPVTMPVGGRRKRQEACLVVDAVVAAWCTLRPEKG